MSSPGVSSQTDQVLSGLRRFLSRRSSADANGSSANASGIVLGPASETDGTVAPELDTRAVESVGDSSAQSSVPTDPPYWHPALQRAASGAIAGAGGAAIGTVVASLSAAGVVAAGGVIAAGVGAAHVLKRAALVEVVSPMTAHAGSFEIQAAPPEETTAGHDPYIDVISVDASEASPADVGLVSAGRSNDVDVISIDASDAPAEGAGAVSACPSRDADVISVDAFEAITALDEAENVGGPSSSSSDPVVKRPRFHVDLSGVSASTSAAVKASAAGCNETVRGLQPRPPRSPRLPPDNGRQKTGTYGDYVLSPLRLPRTWEQLNLLAELSNSSDGRLNRLCRDTDLQRVGLGSRVFARRKWKTMPGLASPRGCNSFDAEVYFLGSETDYANRPDGFAESWFRTNLAIAFEPLDESICPENGGAKVHAGFQQSYLTLIHALEATLFADDTGLANSVETSDGSDRLVELGSVILIGYSQGAALATLAAVDLASSGKLPDKVEVVTCGSPRVGDSVFKKLVHDNFPHLIAHMANLTNALDIVPHVPFNHQDLPDSTEPTVVLWKNIESTLEVSQDYVSAGVCGYRHVVKPTVLDGLAAGLTGSLMTLAPAVLSGAIFQQGAVLSAMGLPREFIQHHTFERYIGNLKNSSKPAWLLVSTILLSGVSSSQPAVATVATVATGAEAFGAVAGAAAGVPLCAAILPQVMGAAVSAYGCYQLGQRLELMAGQMDRHNQRIEGTVGELAHNIEQLSQEMSATRGGFEEGLARFESRISRQRQNDFVMRVRVSCLALADELVVVAKNPTDTGRQAIRDGARDLRRHCMELFHEVSNLQREDAAGSCAQEIAEMLNVALAGCRLHLLASAMVDEADAGIRAAQAIQHASAVLGRFHWRYAISDDLPCFMALSGHSERFFGLAISLSGRREDGLVELNRLRDQGRSDALFSAMALDSTSGPLRLQLALTNASDGPVSAPTVVRIRAWLADWARQMTTPGNHSRVSDHRNWEAADPVIIAAVAHLLPIYGQPVDVATAAEMCAAAADKGYDLTGQLRSLCQDELVVADQWIAFTEESKQRRYMQLLRQVCSACVLPEETAANLQKWMSHELSLDDITKKFGRQNSLAACSLEEMSHALENDSRTIEGHLQKSRDVFQDLAAMLQDATAHLGEDEQPAIEKVKVELDRDLSTLNEETRYVLFGGMVSAGKTTLINAVLLHVVPGLREALKPDSGGMLNLMPTAFNENTRIVTEVRLTPKAELIELALLECDGGGGVVQPQREPSWVQQDDDTEMAEHPQQRNGNQAVSEEFTLVEGFPETYSNGPKGWRKLQRRMNSICESDSPIGKMLRLKIIIPSADIVSQSISIIDSPGLDSPLVWRQLESLVRAKAFMFVWVGALDSPTAFGLQGKRLVDLYRDTGHPLSPILALTKWDRLRVLPEFARPDKLSQQVNLRLQDLRKGLIPLDSLTISMDLETTEDVEEVIDALHLEWPRQRWVLNRQVDLKGQIAKVGSIMLDLSASNNAANRCVQECSHANVALSMRSMNLPFNVNFLEANADVRSNLLLASTDARSAVTQEEYKTQYNGVAELWSGLVPLLNGLAEPLRVSRRLQRIVVATQQAVNILLKDDQHASVYDQNKEELNETKRKVAESFKSKVEEYFLHFPEIAERPEFVPVNCRAKVSIWDYRPPPGLSRNECATSLIPKFLLEGHEMAKGSSRSQYAYVKAVATYTLEQWQSKFVENMVRFERDCLQDLQWQINNVMRINGVLTHQDWQADLKSLIVSPLEVVGFGALAASVAGGYAFLIGEALLGAGLSFAFPVGLLAFGTVAMVMFENSPFAKHIGAWSYDDGQFRAAQTVLDILNGSEAQSKAKGLVIAEFEKRLGACMDQLADLRDPSASSLPEAKVAIGIQSRVTDLQRSLGNWFKTFVDVQVRRDPWIAKPQADLKQALDSGNQFLNAIEEESSDED